MSKSNKIKAKLNSKVYLKSIPYNVSELKSYFILFIDEFGII
jgi:hypothetical protein